VEPAAWQNTPPAEILHAASQPPTSDQLVMHQPYVDGVQHQQVHHEAPDDGTVSMPHLHGTMEDQHIGHSGLAPEQSELYGNRDEHFRKLDAAAAVGLKEGLGEADAALPVDSGVHAGTKRHHTTHAGHVEPGHNTDPAAASVCIITAGGMCHDTFPAAA
jgi:hypothetical protein